MSTVGCRCTVLPGGKQTTFFLSLVTGHENYVGTRGTDRQNEMVEKGTRDNGPV